MSLILSGTDGLSDVDGTAATPAIRGTDTNTGIFFPAADTIAFSEGGVEALRLNSSGQIAASTDGTASVPVFTRSTDTNTGLFFPAADTVAASVGGTERLRLDSSGNLGLGVTPSAWFSSAKVFQIGNGLSLWSSANTNAALSQNLYLDATATYRWITANPATNFNQSNGAFTWQLAAGTPSANGAIGAFTTHMTLDATGNLGLGVTPSAWTTFTSALEVPGGALSGISANQVGVWQNCFYNSSSFKYKSTAGATLYQQAGSTHAWFTAPSGTAGNTISFTQAMTLDSSGRLLVGTTTAADSNAMLNVYNPNATSAQIVLQNTTTGVGSNGSRLLATGNDLYITNKENGFMAFETNDTERARITSAGYLLVGTTAAVGDARLVVNNPDNVSGDFCFVTTLGSNCNNTSSYHYIAATGAADKFYVYGNGNVVNTNGSYGTLSDVKLKENIVDATPKLADVMRLQVRNFNLKTEPGHKQIGFVAQEFEQVFPAMVDESFDRDKEGNQLETTTKHIKTSVLVPILVKAIQEQQAIIESLTARITALEAK